MADNALNVDASIATALQSVLDQQSAAAQLSQDPQYESAASHTNKKRKNAANHDDDDGTHGGQPQQRAKRSRYISIACNECKRRKIKCNGENPCQRCGNLNLECIYAPNCCTNNFKDSAEYKALNGQMAALQEQINFLLQNVNALRGALGQETFTPEDVYFQSQVNQAASAISAPQSQPLIDPSLQARKQSIAQPRFQGPTSPAFSLGLARSSLQSMGITGSEDAGGDELNNAQHVVPAEPPRPQAAAASIKRDPLLQLNRDEATRLCNIYEDEVGVMNPVLDIQEVKSHANFLFTFIGAVSETMPPNPPEFQEEGSDILRLILAIALVVEGTGESELGQRLFESVNSSKNFRNENSPTLKDIQVVVLMAVYHFHVDNEDLAWRVIGLAARMSLEIGLHRIDTYEKHFAAEPGRSAALRIFWSIYVLDRRFSYGTGRGFALQESDIDQTLPKPTESSPYQAAMISFSALCTKAWRFIDSGEANGGASSTISRQDIQYLDYEIIHWLNSIPTDLRYIHPGSEEYRQHPTDPNEAGGRVLYKLRVILYLRANQARLYIYRPILSSATSILTGSPDFAQTPVDVAKDTIRILHHVNQTSESYRTHQITYNYFLLGALATLFLAVSHAPAQFAESSREEFHIALELVRNLSAHSYVSKRLWRTIRGLKEIGPKIGLYTPATGNAGDSAEQSIHNSASNSTLPRDQPQHNQPQPQQQQSHQGSHDAHSSAAMGLAGLAGHPVDENIFYGPNGATNGRGSAQPGGPEFVASPNVMANDLTNLFEAAGIFAAGPTAATMQAAAFARDGLIGQADAQGQAADEKVLGDASARGADGHSNGHGGNEDELNRVMREMF